MKEEKRESVNNSSWVKALGIAMAIPSTTLGLFFLLNYLHQKQILDFKYGLFILIFAIMNSLYLIIRSSRK
jgi:hypothetical protein